MRSTSPPATVRTTSHTPSSNSKKPAAGPTPQPVPMNLACNHCRQVPVMTLRTSATASNSSRIRAKLSTHPITLVREPR